jgi:hypothetical protein
MVFTKNTRSRIPYTLYPVLRKRISFLSVTEVYESVIDSFRTNRRQVTNKVYFDVWSGIYIINNHLFVSKNGKILCCQLYMDEVEVVIPLGSKKGLCVLLGLIEGKSY